MHERTDLQSLSATHSQPSFSVAAWRSLFLDFVRHLLAPQSLVELSHAISPCIMQGSACFNADMLRRTLLINQSNDGTNGREQAEPPQLRLFPSITPSRLASGAGSRDSNVGEAVHTSRRTNPMPDNWQTLKHRYACLRVRAQCV